MRFGDWFCFNPEETNRRNKGWSYICLPIEPNRMDKQGWKRYHYLYVPRGTASFVWHLVDGGCIAKRSRHLFVNISTFCLIITVYKFSKFWMHVYNGRLFLILSILAIQLCFKSVYKCKDVLFYASNYCSCIDLKRARTTAAKKKEEEKKSFWYL